MIRFSDVTFTYPDSSAPILENVNLSVAEGELCLVVGRTGSGKSTLLRCVNGLVPRFTGGSLRGTVTVAGRSTAEFAPRELADVVGYVGQDPTAGFVTDSVEDELAYSMENLGVAPEVMRRRVEDVLDLMGLSELRRRPLLTLSGGQRQRVAIGSVLTASPRVLVLDEPTSALDPAAAEEVLAALTRLVHDLAMTVLISEHRLERVVQYADRIVVVDSESADHADASSMPSDLVGSASTSDAASVATRRGGTSIIRSGNPSEMMAVSPVFPPVVELGRLLGWNPLPLSVRDARRCAASIRTSLTPAIPAELVDSEALLDGIASSKAEVVARTVGLGAAYGTVIALQDVDITIRSGEILAVMGRNGSGKSTLLSHLVGLRRPSTGSVEVLGRDPYRTNPKEAIRLVGLVPQDPGLLLYHDSVAAECSAADRDVDLPIGTTMELLNRIVPGLGASTNPRDLSEGQRLGLALAIVLSAAPRLILLDEPTRGLDYAAKRQLIAVLRSLASEDRAVVMVSHDVEVVASAADRVVVLADGELVADGPARAVVVHSPVFAPQMAKVMAPLPLMTVDEVTAVLSEAVG